MKMWRTHSRVPALLPAPGQLPSARRVYFNSGLFALAGSAVKLW